MFVLMQNFSVKTKGMHSVPHLSISTVLSLHTLPSLCFSLFIFIPSSVRLTAVWCVLSVLLYMHMSAQLKESPELTADGALWVREAWSFRSAHSPCNPSSFSLSVFSPKTTEGTLDHYPLCHHLPLCRGMSARSALGFLSRELAATIRRAV